MKTEKLFAVGIALAAFASAAARADDRLFTYTYEPETAPQGMFEFEQRITSRVGRNDAVRQRDFHRLELREEFEYGVTDNYTVSLSVNHQYETSKDSSTGQPHSKYDWTGISIENKFLVLNPAKHAMGLALYLEPTYDGENFELEQKIILGQRHGDWKWALNLTHATEWANHFREREGELEVSLGIARQLTPRWSVGLEIRDHNELPEYSRWENTALYVGPVISYRRTGWWAALTVMPQVYGANYGGDPDGNSALELEGHERWNIRLLFGLDF